jgi:SAM-dependent methyltransferase
VLLSLVLLIFWHSLKPMRRDVLELRQFYATALGQRVRDLVSRKLVQAWGDGRGLDVLGLGYATPYLDLFRNNARRCLALMPAAQGVEVWPSHAPRLSCLSEEAALPLPNALFDRVVLIHALEESLDPLALLQETMRVLAPSGRMILVATNRRGPWANAEATPFGHGQPFTRRQLETLVRAAGLEPAAWSRALYLPPLNALARWADVFEPLGARLWPGLSGLILLEAVKQTYAIKPRPKAARVRLALPGLARPGAIGQALPPSRQNRRLHARSWRFSGFGLRLGRLVFGRRNAP